MILTILLGIYLCLGLVFAYMADRILSYMRTFLTTHILVMLLVWLFWPIFLGYGIYELSKSSDKEKQEVDDLLEKILNEK